MVIVTLEFSANHLYVLRELHQDKSLHSIQHPMCCQVVHTLLCVFGRPSMCLQRRRDNNKMIFVAQKAKYLIAFVKLSHLLPDKYSNKSAMWTFNPFMSASKGDDLLIEMKGTTMMLAFNINFWMSIAIYNDPNNCFLWYSTTYLQSNSFFISWLPAKEGEEALFDQDFAQCISKWNQPGSLVGMDQGTTQIISNFTNIINEAPYQGHKNIKCN